ncbi:MAG: glycoside hydrolase family 43 protein [Xanthomonadales bacterium]|nr:glycoside hydrolase family 43 protein [Xanthomonadales bacterium]
MIENPILPGFNPDPSIVRVGNDYYIAVSTFEWYPGVQIHQSRDLKNWRLASRPLNRAALLDMRGNPDSGGIWAPCLSWDDGLFYLIYTDVKRQESTFKDAHNYLTTCETVDGTWSDPVYLNSSGFDPSLFHDDDGRKWLVNMVWDFRYQKNRFGGIYLQEYCARRKKLIGDIVNIFRGTDLGLTEAPHLYKRNGYYYLVTAEGGTGYTHAMTLARSRDLAGPYEVDPQGYLLTAKDHPELELQRCGHGSLFDTPKGESYLVHLSGRPLKNVTRCPHGRETSLQKTRWTEDGWLRLKGATADGLPEMLVPSPDLEEQPWPEESTCHEFDSPVLPPEFQWLRTPEPKSFMSLGDRPGFLRLTGKASLGSWFEQALVARRQEAFCFTAQTKLEFSPTNFQQCAGLVCYYNTHKYHYLYVSADEKGRRFLDIMSCLADVTGDASFLLSESRGATAASEIGIELPAQGPVWLRCEVAFADLVFSWSLDGKHWQQIPVSLDYSLISDESGKGEGASFTGAFVGMCCQDLSGQNVTADFDCFHYEEVE